ncbi:MAG: AI-2E family transporter [Candidatus Daviesbacteria bacterium]|nr:AI-2E family transporter [Candidatus Daviesbacteria bacterium]
MPRKVDISHRTIIFIAVFALSVWLLYLIRDLLLLLFVAVIFTSALSPAVNFFVKLKLPRALGILITYIIVFAVVGALLASVLPPLIEQTGRLITILPPLLAEKFSLTGFDQSIVQSELTDLSKNLYGLALDLFSNLLTIILLIVLTFYLLLEKENLQDRAANLFVGRADRVRSLSIKIEDKLGGWLRGQLLLSVIIGVTVYIGLIILNIPYALPLALLAGILEVVPVIGPIVSAFPAIGLALTISPLLAGGVTAMYFVVQQLENHVVVPQVMKRAVGLNPLVVILAIAVGGRLLGLVGGILAVPITVVVQIIVADLLKERN